MYLPTCTVYGNGYMCKRKNLTNMLDKSFNVSEHAMNTHSYVAYIWISEIITNFTHLRNPWLESMKAVPYKRNVTIATVKERLKRCWTIRVKCIQFSLNVGQRDEDDDQWKVLSFIWNKRSIGFIQPLESRAINGWCACVAKSKFSPSKMNSLKRWAVLYAIHLETRNILYGIWFVSLL